MAISFSLLSTDARLNFQEGNQKNRGERKFFNRTVALKNPREIEGKKKSLPEFQSAEYHK